MGEYRVTFKEQQVRCYWFAAQTEDGPPEGQQAHTYLPGGEFIVRGKETITVSDFGQKVELLSVRLASVETNEVYYVSLGSVPAHMI
jgi:hypothetical protein